MRRFTIVCAAVVLLAAVAPLVAVGSTPPAFGATVELPDQFKVGENEVRVVVDNTASDDVLFSPIVEVPLGTSLSAPSPDPHVEASGAERTYSVQNASYRSGQSLYVYGEEVPAGETRTYAFTLVVDEAGDRTVEADVRPLYNEPNNVRDAVTATALGVGTLNVEVTDGAGATMTGAAVDVDGTERTGGDLSLSVVEGSYAVGATAAGRALPSVSVDVAPGDEANVSFVAPDSLVAPRVLATTANGSVAADSVVRQTTQAGDATRPTTFELSVVVDSDDGTSVVGVAPPPEIPGSFAGVSATVDGTPTPVTTAEDGTLLVETTGPGPHDVTLSLEGYATGDASGDGTVDAGDARRIAEVVAGGGVATGYADVNGDGEVTAVDAMLVAQYEQGNRDADYRRAD
ncbi:dockerin type I domain-containing protein [Halorarius halobius]|uniref:dockerin type I domain-containing protein n=1 Tax=Halorarius halobius TaxID=2962671 RepID=UPI0020CD6BA6|nr:dockerin type I domain-containing protein [Halorarius halobius]